jgi:response regulator of citrate/malate metabolism
MAYLIKNKFNIEQLVDLQKNLWKVFLLEPELYLLNLYQSYLHTHEFFVEPAQSVDGIERRLKRFQPHLLILNAVFFEKEKQLHKIINNLKAESINFQIISFGAGLSQEQLKNVMSAGVVSHIDRRFSRPIDIIHIAKSILNN